MWQLADMATGMVGEFEAQRPRMFGLAYRLLGSAQDAEDVVQDAFVRWHTADRAAIAVPSAWLAKVVTNLCVNRPSSAGRPGSRYDLHWVELLPPYNEQLMRDAGGLNLALAAVLAGGALTMERRMIVTGLLAT